MKGFVGLPPPKKAPEQTSFEKYPQNPAVRGYSLAVLTSLVCSFDWLARFLWNQAGFGRLRSISALDSYEPRWDPTVIPPSPEAQDGPPPAPREDADVSGDGTDNFYTASRFHAVYKSGMVTPTTVVKTLLEAIDADEDHRVAFLSIKRDLCLAAAARSTERYQNGRPLGALDGVPIAVKDEVDLEGYPRSFGSKVTFVENAGESSWCVQKWEDAGAVLLGKLSMHEFGMDTTNNNVSRGTPCNPHNPKFYTGGSSGGSAYVVSTGLCLIALGADGGGSIRLPASYCGVYGLKPTHGRVSASPTPSLACSVGVVGPMAASVEDLATAYRIMAAPDPSVSISSSFPNASVYQAPNARKKIIGMIPDQFFIADPPVRFLCQSAVDLCTKSLGYDLLPDLSIPFLAEGQRAHAMTILTEIASLAAPLLKDNFSKLTLANKALIRTGQQTPGQDFLLAQKLRNMLMQHLSSLFAENPDLIIVSPTAPAAGRAVHQGDLSHGFSDPEDTIRSMKYVWLANFVGCPAITIPVGKAEGHGGGKGDVPVGLMGMGMWGNEEGLLAWAADLESAKRRGLDGSDNIGARRPSSWFNVLAKAKENA